MRALSWLLRLWYRIEPAEHIDWILETLGLRERVRQIIAAGLGGVVMLIFQRLRDSPADWTALMVLGSAGLIFYVLNQLSQWSNNRNTYNTLRGLNPNAQPTITFFTRKRILAYSVTTFFAIFALTLHRSPSGIDWPWTREAPTLQAPPQASETPPPTPKKKIDFEDVASWSVSFRIDGVWLAEDHHLTLERCWFSNLSTSQRRIIDVKIVIPTRNYLYSSVVLDTEIRYYGIDNSRRKEGMVFGKPIILEPSSFDEGRIEFDIDEKLSNKISEAPLRMTDWLLMDQATVYVKEHRSGETINVAMAYARASGLSRSGVQNRNTGVSCSSIWDEQDERRVWM
jgi:hypothetical protein